MSRDQTVFSELAVAYGINDNSLDDIQGLDTESLEKFHREKHLRSNSTNQEIKDSEAKLNKAGEKIKIWLREKKHIQKINLSWVANVAPETGETVAQDLIVVNTGTRISVKENAELFQNPSPPQVFEFWPRGMEFTRARSDDWYISVASKELNDYFVACNGPQITGHRTIEDYYANTTGTKVINGKRIKKRKFFTEYVKELHDQNDSSAKSAYKIFCDAVGRRSADCFNTNFQKTFQKTIDGYFDIDELTNLVSVFFKMDDREHLLAGTEKNESFAVLVQDINTWKKGYSVVNIAARPLDAGQPETLIEFIFRNNLTQTDYRYGIQSQIRWSHGKFCGNPEGKLYRYGNWKYTELPWCTAL